MLDLFSNIFAAGSAAMLTCGVVHPIDVVKTRLQVSGGNGARNYKALGLTGTLHVIAAQEGIPAFWKGIGAALLREASYTSLRLGLYSPIKNMMNVRQDSPMFMKFIAGSMAGALGSVAGNPFDVLKTRLMATEGKNFGLIHVGKELYQQQGVSGFYRGLDANIMRAMVLNGTKMSCYDTIKGHVQKSGIVSNKLTIQFVSAFSAGFFMAITVTPFDMVRTALMNQPIHGEKLYHNFADCAIKLFRSGGIRALYAGFVPIWGRFAPNTTIQLVLFEQLKPVFGLK